ncbi:DMT family transporter [Candidatus Gottesmanbacteria bacterium]|nr:DMT family transporter [Candidatus Gottesmanbacteria bacterium]
MKNYQKGLFFGVLTTIIFSLDLFPAKLLVSKFPPLVVTVWTSLVIGILFLPITLVLSKYSLRKVNRKDIPLLLVFGILASGIGGYFALSGLQIVPVSEAAFLLQLEVVFATLTAYVWLKESIVPRQLLGMGLLLFGAYLLSQTERFNFRIGEIMLVSGTLAFGITDVMTKKIDPQIPTSVVTSVRFLIGGIFLIPFVINGGTFPTYDGRDILLILLNGFFYLTGVTFLYSSLKYLPGAIGSFFLVPAMFLAAILGVVFLKENMTLQQWIGGCIIVAGLVTVIFKKV